MREPRPDWSPLGVNFKILDEHPYLFVMIACRTLLSWENASLTVDSFYVILIAFLVLSFCSANKALLLSNLGRLMRLCAQAVGGVETKLTGRRGEFTQEERGYFNKVLYCFSMLRLSRCPAGPVLVFCPSADVSTSLCLYWCYAY